MDVGATGPRVRLVVSAGVALNAFANPRAVANDHVFKPGGWTLGIGDRINRPVISSVLDVVLPQNFRSVRDGFRNNLNAPMIRSVRPSCSFRSVSVSSVLMANLGKPSFGRSKACFIRLTPSMFRPVCSRTRSARPLAASKTA